MAELQVVTMIITIVLFVGTVLGAAVKYGSDQRSLRSEMEMLKQRQDQLRIEFSEEKTHNSRQHEEFYLVKNDTIELKTDMKHIMLGIEEIKRLLGDRRG